MQVRGEDRSCMFAWRIPVLTKAPLEGDRSLPSVRHHCFACEPPWSKDGGGVGRVDVDVDGRVDADANGRRNPIWHA